MTQNPGELMTLQKRESEVRLGQSAVSLGIAVQFSPLSDQKDKISATKVRRAHVSFFACSSFLSRARAAESG